MVKAHLPLAISCQGGTLLARLAADVAAALDDLGVAEATQDPDQVIALARAGRTTITLDGCPSACQARRLEAKGLRLKAAFNLAELGIDEPTLDEADPASLAGEVATRLRSRTRGHRQPRAPRPARPAVTARTKRAHDVDDYLLAIDSLASATVECGALVADAPTLAAHVSRVLAVSRVSAGEMLARLATEGLVERGARKELLLTELGRVAADRVVCRHRLLERFASDVLGYPFAECHQRARVLDDAFDDDAVERLRIALGNPARCPHGWPIDPQRARDESRELTALSTLVEKEEATVVRVAEHDGPCLAQFCKLGITPGAKLLMERVQPEAESIDVHVGGVTRRLQIAAATKAFVRR